METSNSVSSGAFLGPVALFDRAWMIFERRWKTALLVLLPLVGAFILFFVLVAVLVGSSFVASGELPNLSTIGAGLLVVGVILYILLIIVSMWGQLALLNVVVNHDRDISVKEAYGSTKQYILSYIWMSILMGLIVASGFVFFIIPGIIFLVWFAFSHYVLVAQNVRGLNALLTSREYVRGRWWGVFGRFLALGVVYFILLILLGAVQDQVDAMDNGLLSTVVGLVSGVIQMVLNFLAMLYAFVMYDNLKSLKGATIPIASSTRKKFTALAIVGVLAMGLIVAAPIVLIGLNPANTVKLARDADRMSDLSQIQQGLVTHYAQSGEFPASLDVLVGEGSFTEVPVDPSTKQPYLYSVSPDGQDYTLCMHPESESIQKNLVGATMDADGNFCFSSSYSNEESMMPYDSGTMQTLLEGESATDGASLEDDMIDSTDEPSDEDLMRY